MLAGVTLESAPATTTATDEPANLRDLRGLRTDDGAVVRRGVLYRSEALRSPHAGTTDVPVWPPTTVIDLRSPEEYFGPHPLDVDGTTVHAVPLGAGLAPALAASADPRPDLVFAYRHLAHDAAAEIARIAGLVAAARGPVLVHCTAGKDRTGIVVAVLLAAVGVRRADVVADYLRTRANLPRLWAALHAAGVPSPHNPALLGVQAEAIEAVLDDVESAPGGAAGWLTAHGVGPAALEGLRSRLLVAVSAPVR
jgi:protein-tyrosine phosphatase